MLLPYRPVGLVPLCTTRGRRATVATFMMAAVLMAPVRLANAVEAPRVTIVDGGAEVVVGARRFSAIEGQPLPGRALIETAAAARLLRIEWPGGQVVDLGPGTRVMLSPPAVGVQNPASAAVYLLQGWIKQTSPGKGPDESLLSPHVETTPAGGAAVHFVGVAEHWLFVESGSVSVVERGQDKASAVVLRRGSAYSRRAPAKGTVSARPSAQEMQRVPRAFLDPLPFRFDAMKTRSIKLQALPPPTYAQLQPWLVAEKGVREGFTTRFDELLRDRQFRQDLGMHLRDHREWQPVLFPPQPKPGASPADVSAGR